MVDVSSRFVSEANIANMTVNMVRQMQGARGTKVSYYCFSNGSGILLFHIFLLQLLLNFSQFVQYSHV